MTQGLTSAEAARALQEHGPNELHHEAGPSPFKLFLGQLKSPVIWLLLGACAVSGALGEVADAIAIGAIVLINAFVGFFQEYRAERAMQALRAMTAPRARVVRDGKTVLLPAAEVVPGDLLALEAGDVVAADARLVEAHRLMTNEAALTGESVPVEKTAAPSAAGAPYSGRRSTGATDGVAPAPQAARPAPLAERHDCVFLGTAVADGTGRAVVTGTGMHTELGKIADLLATAEETETPLAARLARVSKLLLWACLGIVTVVAALGLLRGVPPFELFLSAVSLAVAAVPEGLPAIVTIALAIGVQRMVSRHVLVRKLPAVETLGCTTVICTDKTGTLTTGVMAVRELWAGPGAPSDRERALLDAAAACCDAQDGIGDPTELALLEAAKARFGIEKSVIERERPRVSEHPFDSVRRRMSIRRADGVLYVKGAAESVLEHCIGDDRAALAENGRLAARGLRVLAIATGQGTAEQELKLLGLIGIADPPRPEAVAAVTAARHAGIITVMITGDHPVTARAIARELGIAPEQVHARATPEQKLELVREWKAKGAVVAMTGDGVNDAPALREAHVGICMGKTGTEVTREASDVVLTDDNFASIVAAVREGRGIFQNIRSSLVYLLSGNLAELLIMLATAAIGFPLPLLPLHLLWVNLVTDGLPALALVMEKPDRDVMGQKPRPQSEAMLRRHEWVQVAITGVFEGAISLGIFVWALKARGLDEARGLAFSSVVCAQLFRSFAARSTTRVFWELGAFTNLALLAVVVVSVAAQFGIHTLPFARALFSLGPVPLTDLLLPLGGALVPVTALELFKLIVRGGRSGRARHAPALHGAAEPPPR